VSPELQLEKVNVDAAAVSTLKGATEGIFIVRLDGAPLASYRGGVAGLSATSPEATGVEKLDTASADSIAYADYLRSSQATFVGRLEKTLGHSADVRYNYINATNGLAVWLTPSEASRVARMPGVESVQQEVIQQLATDVGPTFIGAPSIWGGDTSCETGGDCGEGVVVGVLDTGINAANPSFASPGPVDNYVYTNPLDSYVGVCDNTDPDYDETFVCNDKLIGAWDYTGLGAFDSDGHGSHTASTATGNFVDASVVAPTLTVDVTISGVAPHANLIAYHVCDEDGCPSSNTMAAIDQAIADGVDVINYSIGSPSAEDPWTSDEELAWLAVREAGIFVAHSAGNEGPDAATVGSPMAPWMTHVAAVTHNRKYVNNLVDLTGGNTTPPDDIAGLGFTSGYGPAEIVYAGDYASDLTDTPELCGVGLIGDNESPWPAGTFDGEIVVCDRGTFGRVEKGANVLAAGAGGFILVDDGSGLVGDGHDLPAVHITQSDGEVLKTWLADGGASHTGTISGATADYSASNGDIMAGFSSRGPNQSVANMIAPSLAAPGVDIIAANGTDNAVSWGFLSGTSMASPHIAGAAALLVGVHPDWTPAEIQSAMMTTATTEVLKEDASTAADAFDQGSGRVQLENAVDAGLLMDIDNATFAAADPATGGDPGTLNLPSMANSQCVLECSWTRTVTATANGTWTTSATAADFGLSVSPTTLTLTAGESADITITADVSSAAPKVWAFGEVSLASSGMMPDAHLPVAVRPTTGDFPALVNIEARRDAGSVHLTDLTAIEITDFTVTPYGLTKGDVTSFLVPEDATNDSSYDSSQGTWVTTVDVPDGAQRLVAETFDTTAPDLDLRIGTGDSPSEATEVCTSATASNEEYCNVDAPTAGTYWIQVQNWQGSGAAEDEASISIAVVTADEGNLDFSGPASQPELEPFDADVIWDLTDPALGDRYYGAIGMDTGESAPAVSLGARNNIGVINVDLMRVGDDVSKTAVVDGDAEPGSVVTFEIVVEPNPTATDLEYQIEDVLPDGLTYVPGSATGGLVEDSGTLTWTGVMPAIGEAYYTVTDSNTDAMCDTGFGGYLDLAAFEITPDASISGDSTQWSAFSGQNPFQFFDDEYAGLKFTDDGFVEFGSGYPASAEPWTPQVIPDAAPPNGLIAGFWHDFEIVYDAATNSGVSLATAGPETSVVEYDNLRAFGTTTPMMDMEIVLTSTADNTPGYYEAVVAFDNVTSTPVGTIGVENKTGTEGEAVLNNADSTGVISDGYQVCFNLTPGLSDPKVLTYDAVVSPDAESSVITNEVSHTVDQLGAKTEVASYDLAVGVPVAPTDGDSLWAENVLSDSLTLMWDPASDASGIDAYHLYVDGEPLGDVAGDVTEYAVSDLMPQTTYEFEVVAEDGPGNLSDGLTASVTTATDFTDDNFSIFENDIEWLSGMGITKGCNPPVNDMYCPERTLTRGELAAMINRALDLPAATDDYFTDDDNSIFEDAINRLAEAGITKGCNKDGTLFCPDTEVTRGEIAAFFDRALDLPAATDDYFTDDDNSIFEANINNLAEAGITRGCNPPANDNFCPLDNVTRGQIAAFFHRALG
jgi:uncharacterized repeat protein (TIGR01451 family)